MVPTRLCVGAMLSSILVFNVCVVSGQDYPTKPIRIVTNLAGGGTDFTARIVAQGISGPLGQPVIVDNRPQILTPDIVAKAPSDGYTLLVNGGNIWIYPLMQKAGYDAVRDLSPITIIERTVSVIAVYPAVPAKSVKELVAFAKAKPGELNFASSSIGGTSHLACELFKSVAGVNIVHVPYKSTGLAVTALIAGEVQMVIFDAGVIAPHVATGKLRALAVTSAEPSTLAPGLPTAAASGLPGYEAVSINGMWAPAKTPDAVIKRLNLETLRVLAQPAVKERFFNAKVEPVGSSVEQFAATIKTEIAKMSKVIKDAGLKTE